MADTFDDALTLHRSGRFAEAEAAYRRLLAAAPGDARLLQHLGLLRAQCGQLEEGRQLLADAVSRSPTDASAQFHFGSVLARLGRPEDALVAFSAAVEQSPDFAEAYFAAGNVLFRLRRMTEAADAYKKAEAFSPGNIEIVLNLGTVLQELGDTEEALIACERALKIVPGHPGALNNRGNGLRLLGRMEEALADFDRALAVAPDYTLARFNRATVLQALRRHEEALAECDHALMQRPDAGVLSLRGTILMSLDRADEALSTFERALALQPGLEMAYHGRISALLALTRWEEALGACDIAIACDPGSAPAHNNRGVALLKLRRLEAAGEAFERAIALDPGKAEGYFNRSGLLYTLDRLDEAYADTAHAFTLRNDFVPAHVFRFNLAAHLCDWSERKGDLDAISAYCRDRHKLDPFPLLYAFDDPEMHLNAARRVAGKPKVALTRTPVGARKRLRVAYMSADFRDHPVTHQAIELFEAHDLGRIETIGVALWPVPENSLGTRIRAAFSQVVELYDRSDQEIARRLAELNIDVVVELGGYSDKSRSGALAWRPAPVTATYLGYPGTLGARYVDYLIGDAVTIPPQDDHFYEECVVRLPVCFMPFDSQTLPALQLPTRTEQGLPEKGFVFCNFNKTDKITPEVFSLWMKILRRVPGSVLWMSVHNETARRNLRAAAEARGVALQRIVFASHAEGRPEHLARLALADLFLDTMPYNAHATTSDFLAAGVPVLTTYGKSFAARVAASMLHQLGADGLVAPDVATYEAMAVHFAEQPQKLAAWRSKIAAYPRRASDTQALARSLENAYFHMWDRRVRGLKPESFDALTKAP